MKKFDISDAERHLFRVAVQNIVIPESACAQTAYAAEGDKKRYAYPLSDLYPEVVTENEVVEYLAPHAHLSYKIQRSFRQGMYLWDDKMDLHGYALEEACSVLSHRIQQAHATDKRRLLIVHGKGQQGLLKRYTVHWLKQMPPVMYFCSALARHGGTGALYVLLKKTM